jgi:hypothetical protein
MPRELLVVFSDLDGTLLDHTTYEFGAARVALDRLHDEGVPLVLCTSTTRAEVEPLPIALGNRDPFIVENGGGVYVPAAYFPFEIEGADVRDGYRVVPLGDPYQRGGSLAWGVFAIASGAVFARTGSSVLETINLIGSAFYGPVLAVFTLGVLAPRLTGNAPLVGLITGLIANVALARLAPDVSWLWWNPAGFIVACVVALTISRVPPRPVFTRWPRPETVLLLGAFVIMLALLAGASLSIG